MIIYECIEKGSYVPIESALTVIDDNENNVLYKREHWHKPNDDKTEGRQ